jgi:hypothetical protein
VGKFVEFFGPGVAELSIADRATISNMCPEYGATVGFFPVDKNSLSYLRQTSEYIMIYCSIQVQCVYCLFLYLLPSYIQLKLRIRPIERPIRNQFGDLLAWSTVPKPTTLLRAYRHC